MSKDDVDYFRQRAADERELALSSESPEAGAIHEELARLYDVQAENALMHPRHEPEVVMHGVRVLSEQSSERL